MGTEKFDAPKMACRQMVDKLLALFTSDPADSSFESFRRAALGVIYTRSHATPLPEYEMMSEIDIISRPQYDQNGLSQMPKWGIFFRKKAMLAY